MPAYYKLDLTHPTWPVIEASIESQFMTNRPDNILSINRNIADTLAWVKLVQPFPGSHPIILDSALTLQEHADKVIVEVNELSWTGPLLDASGN